MFVYISCPLTLFTQMVAHNTHCFSYCSFLLQLLAKSQSALTGLPEVKLFAVLQYDRPHALVFTWLFLSL